MKITSEIISKEDNQRGYIGYISSNLGKIATVDVALAKKCVRHRPIKNQTNFPYSCLVFWKNITLLDKITISQTMILIIDYLKMNKVK